MASYYGTKKSIVGTKLVRINNTNSLITRKQIAEERMEQELQKAINSKEKQGWRFSGNGQLVYSV